MGAQQSSQDGPGATDGFPGAAAAATGTRKACYYEVLGVERSADDAEIRRAYKKKALELHPDRNYNDEENATRKFAEVQTAYEILNDPQERAWYDSHRDAILRGDDGPDGEDAGDGPPERHYNVRLTTTDEIMTLIGRFNSRVPFTDSPSGFFGILDVTFGQLATEEAAACDWDNQTPVDYPPFGAAGDGHDDTARPFYAAWSNFATKKSFAWKERWRLSDAPDRRVRRLMEKENKKLREDAVRDFNDAVRSLVAFVKKRDPRYKPSTQSEADRQRILRESAANQAARARAANLEKLRQADVAAEWAQSRGDDDPEHNDEFATSEEESEVECFECALCNKVFKSEKQYEAHEKSKKHVKAVQQLTREMRKEGRDLRLDDQDEAIEALQENISPGVEDVAQYEDVRPASPVEDQDMQELADDSSQSSSAEVPLDEEYAPREVVEGRLASDPRETLSGHDAEARKLASKMMEVTLDSEDAAPKKLGKAKAKRAKRAAQAQAQEISVCCNSVFLPEDYTRC